MTNAQMLKTAVKQAKADASARCWQAPYAMAPTLQFMLDCYRSAISKGVRSAAGVWQFRVTLAQVAWALQRASRAWQPTPDTPDAPAVLRMTTQRLEAAVGELGVDSDTAQAMKSALITLATAIVQNVQLERGDVERQPGELAKVVRLGLSMAGFILGRASAAVWKAILDQQAEDHPWVSPAETTRPSPTPEAVQEYRKALQQFATTVKALPFDPADLAAGVHDAQEAQSLCDVLGFLLERQATLRGWTRPEVFLSDDWSTEGGRAADNADRRLALFNFNALDLMGTVRGWSLRGHEEAGTEIVDLLANLRHLAEASGFDWDTLLARADNFVDGARGEDDVFAG